jgi:hypothetical protein
MNETFEEIANLEKDMLANEETQRSVSRAIEKEKEEQHAQQRAKKYFKNEILLLEEHLRSLKGDEVMFGETLEAELVAR